MGLERKLTEAERKAHESKYNQLYYTRHRDRIRAMRKLRYESDPDYRQKVIKAAIRSRERRKKMKAAQLKAEGPAVTDT